MNLKGMLSKTGILLLFAQCLLPANAYAAAWCWNEQVMQLLVSGEYIHFTTDKSCPQWCRVDPNLSAEAQNRAYSTLLAAKSNGKKVSFNWAELSSECGGAVTVFSQPLHIMVDW